VTAVDGVDLTIEYGETVALLGPNGAGKTTTVEILEGHRPRTAARSGCSGSTPVAPTVPGGRRSAIVLQDATDSVELRVGEVVSHFARYYPDPRRPAEVLELVGLAEQARRPVRLLSGGQRRRLDVAVGIVGRPG
jgi:ABC-2 type transport system ATP-binding protein